MYYIINSKNCRAYNSFISVASDHRIISVNIILSLRANNKKSSKISDQLQIHGQIRLLEKYGVVYTINIYYNIIYITF